MKIVNKNTNYDSTDNNMHECVHTCACTHAHTYTRTRMYMHTCTHTHSYALTHTHTYKESNYYKGKTTREGEV